MDRHMQYFTGIRYIDDVAMSRVDTTIDGTYNKTRYHITDVQISTVAILDSSAALVERISYDAYGKGRHHYMADLDGDGDGDVDSGDSTALLASLNKSIGDAAEPQFKNWPRSMYKSWQTNSNTFVRVAVRSAGLFMSEMDGWHPGHMNPSQNTDSSVYGGLLGFYAAHTPWKSSGAAKPKPGGKVPY